MPALSAADQLLYSTVKLTTFCNGAATGSGTAFFYTLRHEGMTCPVLITNKHVLDGADQVQATFHIGTGNAIDGPTGKIWHYRMNIQAAQIALHPDSNVDLCAICVADTMNTSHAQGKPIFYVTLSSENIPDSDTWDNFDSIEELVMVGCPNGLFDQLNNIPIIRRGTTATPLCKRYNGASEFLIDMACFPGSSGSPIFIYDRVGYFDRKKNVFAMGAQRQYFVGILYSGPVISNSGEIILANAPRVDIDTMMHLGNAIKSSEVLTLERVMKDLLSKAAA